MCQMGILREDPSVNSVCSGYFKKYTCIKIGTQIVLTCINSGINATDLRYWILFATKEFWIQTELIIP